MRHLRLLGPVKVESIDPIGERGKSDTGSIPRFRSRSAVALLGYLATERRAVAREFLATLFWPDVESDQGRGKLRRELYNLGRILPGCWETDVQTVRFAPSANTSVDIYLLQQLEEERSWQQASEMVGGEFLEGVSLHDNLTFETWLLAERRRWQGMAQTVLSNAREALIRRGLYADALRYGRRLVQLAPWNEEAHQQVMRLLAWTGRREAALRQFVVCKQILAEELSIEPSTETLELLRQIRDETLAIPPAPPAFLTGGKARREETSPLFVAREREMTWLNQALNEALAGQGGLVFLTGGPGRGKTVLMDAFAQQALKRHPGLLAAKGNCSAGAVDPYLPYRDVMAMLTGDVETRWLAGSINRDHARRLWEALPLVAQSLLEHGPHLLPILLNATRMLKRAAAAEPTGVPWLTQLREQANSSQGETAVVDQSHLFEQFTNVLRAVAEKQPLLLLLDDLQWMNAASAGLLFHLGRRLTNSGSRILIVCAYRPEEIIRDLRGGRQLLAKVLAELRQNLGDVWLSLSWDGKTGAQRFVDAVLDSEPNRLGSGFRSALLRVTRGHPLFTVELLQAMKNRGDLIKDKKGLWLEGPDLDWRVLPTRIEAVIEERVGRLEPELRELLAIASVEGEYFTAEVVGHVQGLSQQQVLGRLSQELEKRHRLIQEREEVSAGQQLLSRYEFGHVLFQRYLYDGLGTGERRLLHGKVGRALEALFESQTEEKASQLAHHFYEAGEGEKAIAYSQQAARRARALHAYEEAIYYLQTALRRLEPGERVETKLVMLEELGDVHRPLIKETQAIAYYQSALDHWATMEDADEMIAVRLHRKILETLRPLWNYRDEARAAWPTILATSRSYLEARIGRARTEPQLEWVRVLNALARITDLGFPTSEDLDTAEHYAQAAVDLAEQLDAPEELSAALNILGLVHFARGQLHDQLQILRRGLSISRDPRFGNPRKQIDIRWGLADALIAVGEYGQAIHHLLEMEELAIQIRFVDLQVWALTMQSLCLLRLDRWDEVSEINRKREELERGYSRDQLGNGQCALISVCAAVYARQGYLDRARVLREQAYNFMAPGTERSTENWGRTQYY